MKTFEVASVKKDIFAILTKATRELKRGKPVQVIFYGRPVEFPADTDIEYFRFSVIVMLAAYVQWGEPKLANEFNS